MIETAQTLSINAAIEQVWNYVQDMQRWAALMPGSQSCTVIDEHDSRWTLKVGAGGLVRTVNVLVHVDGWEGPERVNFSYQLENDPVSGGGAYVACRKGDLETEVTLHLRVEGSGPMAPMWEAVCKPLLPQLAKSFAGKLKTEIENACGTAPMEDVLDTEKSSVWTAIGRKLHLNQ
jgi:carbon monoxide dehydrogenase subunit G